MTPIVMIVPVGTKGRSIRLRVPRDTARWLWRQLSEVLGEPRRKPRRRPRLRRGRWIARSTH
jgi:hypothetical protein